MLYMNPNTLLAGASDKLALQLHLIQKHYRDSLIVVDPIGNVAEAVANSIPKELTERVHYFDPSDTKHIASFNVFENPPDPAKLVQDLCAFFDALYPAGGSTLTRFYGTSVLKNVLTILSDNTNISFLSILQFLSDTDFQARCIKKCTNTIALSNWARISAWDKTQKKNAFGFVETMVGDLLLSPVMHRTLQDPHSTFYLTKTPILIADLSKIGDTDKRLLGTLLISRATTPVYINDFAFFASDYLASLFSQGGYTVALQFLSDVPKNVQQTLLGFPEKYVYRTTLEDAEKLQVYIRGVENPAILVDLSPEEFRPVLRLDLPLARRRLRAVRKRSIAFHTRPALASSPEAPTLRRKRKGSW